MGQPQAGTGGKVQDCFQEDQICTFCNVLDWKCCQAMLKAWALEKVQGPGKPTSGTSA